VPGASYNPTYEDHQVKFLLPGTQFMDNSFPRIDLCSKYACSGLSLSVGCQQKRSPAEKEVIAGSILVGDYSRKNNEWLQSCNI